MNNYVSSGNPVTLVAPSGGVVSGTCYKIGSIIAVAQASADAAANFEGVRVGIFTLPKATGAAWTQGAKLYWDDTAKNFTTTSTSNTLAGYAAAAAASGDDEGSVLLNGAAG